MGNFSHIGNSVPFLNTCHDCCKLAVCVVFDEAVVHMDGYNDKSAFNLFEEYTRIDTGVFETNLGQCFAQFFIPLLAGLLESIEGLLR